MGIKLERVTISLEERELMELENLLQDGDRDAALAFLRELRKKILEMQRRRMGGTI